MAVPSLQHLALRAIVKNISTLESVGDLPYDFCRPFLVKVENPDQLRRIEENSPNIMGEDAELWKAFCKRDVPHYARYADEPSNPTSWWKFYRYVKKKDKEENAIQEAKLREKMEALNKERTQNTAGISDKLIDTRSRKTQFSNHPAYSRVRRGPIATPKSVQLPPHLLAERKAAAQKKSGLPDDPVTATRLKRAQTRAEGQNSRGPFVTSGMHRSLTMRTSATSKRSAPSLSSTTKPKASIDELFDDLPDEIEPVSPPPASSPKASPPPQPSLPTGIRVPPPNLAATPSVPKKRRREVNVFMPSKKR